MKAWIEVVRVETLSYQHHARSGSNTRQARLGYNMVSRKITINTGQKEDTGCSPPFSQTLLDGDYSLLRAKILAKLDDEDVRAALVQLGLRPL
jgi:hypothetical protein